MHVIMRAVQAYFHYQGDNWRLRNYAFTLHDKKEFVILGRIPLRLEAAALQMFRLTTHGVH